MNLLFYRFVMADEKSWYDHFLPISIVWAIKRATIGLGPQNPTTKLDFSGDRLGQPLSRKSVFATFKTHLFLIFIHYIIAIGLTMIYFFTFVNFRIIKID